MDFDKLAESQAFYEFFRIVQNLTGLLVALVDPSGTRSKQLFSEEEFNPFCRLIQSVPEGVALCRETDRANCERAAKSREAIHYLCHAGLVDLAVPIFVDGQHVATMNFGQVLLGLPLDENYNVVSRRLDHLNLPEGSLSEAYFGSPNISPEQLDTVVRLCTFFAEYCCVVGREMGEARQQAGGDEIHRAQVYIRTHFRDTCSLSDTARHAGLSPAYFSTRFRQTAGVTYTQYLNSIRVDEAKRLLIDTDGRISDIASSVGYSNVTHFNRVFLGIVGMSPSMFRAFHFNTGQMDQ